MRNRILVLASLFSLSALLIGCSNDHPTCPRPGQGQVLVRPLLAPYQPGDTLYVRVVNDSPYGVTLSGNCLIVLERRVQSEWQQVSNCGMQFQTERIFPYDIYQEEVVYDPTTYPAGEYRAVVEVGREISRDQLEWVTVRSEPFQLLPK